MKTNNQVAFDVRKFDPPSSALINMMVDGIISGDCDIEFQSHIETFEHEPFISYDDRRIVALTRRIDDLTRYINEKSELCVAIQRKLDHFTLTRAKSAKLRAQFAAANCEVNYGLEFRLELYQDLDWMHHEVDLSSKGN